MAGSGAKTVCCQGLDLPTDEQAGLVCDIGGQPVAGTYQNGSVVCTPLEGGAPDVEQQGLRLRVVTSKGRTVHEGTLDEPAGLEPAAEEAAPQRRQTFRERYSSLKPFAIISVSYLLYTITDGAVRMIVLLRAYQLHFSAMEVAIMFSFYEAAGVVTNLMAGLMGARWGIKTTLLTGLALQLGGLGMLFGWQAIVYVTAAQALCGVAKDLTKLGGKTVTKLVTPDEKQSTLFKLVSFITGFKNSLKGAGYFLGAATVAVNYYMSLGILCGLILAAMPWAIVGLSNQLGRARKENVRFSALFENSHNVNVLSASRVFLFGARDLWFEVPLPFFLRSAASGIGWSRAATGAFLAAFIIVYGQAQSWTPQLVLRPLRQSPPTKWVAAWWCATLAAPTTVLGIIMLATNVFGPGVDQGAAVAAITTLLYTFCILFAVNSAVHSYLIVRYSEGDKVAMNVGVYYCANAVGRLVGTLASGALYSYVGDTVVIGFGVCLMCSVAFSVTSTVIDFWLHEDVATRFALGCFPRADTRAAALPEAQGSKAEEEEKPEAAADPASAPAVELVSR